MKRVLRIDNLDCASCAAEIETAVSRLEGVHSATVNFLAKKMTLDIEETGSRDILERVFRTTRIVEPEAVLRETDIRRRGTLLHLREFQLLIGFPLFLAGILLPTSTGWVRLAAFFLAYAVLGSTVLWKAFRNLFHGRVFDENFLMGIATVGAFFVGDFPEAVAVMLFYQIGEYFQNRAVERSRKSIADLMEITPDHASVLRNGEWVETDPESVAVGETILLRPGDRVPLDGTVLEGSSLLDTSSLTGETLPREAGPGTEVLSGFVNRTASLRVRVRKPYADSTIRKVMDLVENAGTKKAKSELFIARFARIYTPAVVGVALLLAVLPPLLFPSQTFSVWIYRALSFLVVSCPCALVISIPLSFFGGIGGASRAGVLVKGSDYLEALAKTEIMVFDKTGTLTKGVFRVRKVHPVGKTSPEALLETVALAELSSSHPIAESLRKAWGKPLEASRAASVEEVPGKGIRATVDGKPVLAGNPALLRAERIATPPVFTPGTVVHVAVGGRYAGWIAIADEVKSGAAETIRQLKAGKVKKTVMLTGDKPEVGKKVAQSLRIDKVYSGLLPQDKVEKVEKLLDERSKRGKLAYVGDGINDAPVLARADVGIAMGGAGSDAAIEAADIVIMDDEPAKIPLTVGVSRKTMAIVYQNIALALGTKGIVLLLSAFGITSMWMAIFADVGVTLLAILNASRASLTVPKRKKACPVFPKKAD